ncbi:hypothetical protein O7599_23190 [Streptomyces sp. WMMC500]|uniref:hypothetical protein n=1 Tax=Streptomyces sp. WMMC500 TaxID=3015154 RepID=UPI00248B12A3|nr:hypothetical protein [Streptomyces sp. WMMC500]WBB58531.1 hypothetical protein O7599_23190 [Streptomyces sp. WMMC500]
MNLLDAGTLASPIDPDEFKPGADCEVNPNCQFDPVASGAGDLLGLLAWVVTACAVGGLLILGIQLAFQFRRGEPGEGAHIYRGGVIVMGACILGATAGPLVEYLVDPYLVNK